MAVAQNTFGLYRGTGYEGQQSTIDVNDVISRTVETASIAFGRAVVRGVGKESCAPATDATAGDVIGFTVRTMAAQNNAAEVAEYAIGETASVLRRGRLFAACTGGASAGDTVHVVVSGDVGSLSGVAGESTVELNAVTWVNAVADGEIGEIQADGILTIEREESAQ